MGPRAGWTGAENFASTGIRSPDRSARSQSLYRLRYRPTKSDRIQLYLLLNTFHASRVHTSCRFVTHEVVSQSSVIVWACIFEEKLRRLLAILVHYILIQVASRLHLQDKSGMQSRVFAPTAWNELYVVLSLIRLHFCLMKSHGVCEIKMASIFRNMASRHSGTGVRRFEKA